jgi:hypothetical protein
MLGPQDLVVDIGSNDGTLISNFKAGGIACSNEPTDVGKIATSRTLAQLRCGAGGKRTGAGAKLTTAASHERGERATRQRSERVLATSPTLTNRLGICRV